MCAFGVAATAPVANALVNPAISLRECGLSVLYGLVVGLVIGFVVIRARPGPHRLPRAGRPPRRGGRARSGRSRPAPAALL